ncbi:hypothetical protein UFOVP142_35 [uncultured Caudovirales phage]|uniref:Uncharacterized protein n=1 Tax=uncultured Caudovirales phage TaxID=2100421 RepID=A0A6J7XL04_9CAUD|nr:hypothetical protein UFOVP142_35 [uncultured Caudovirales phage]
MSDKATPKETAKKAIQSGVITSQSEASYASLIRLMELPSQTAFVAQRIAAVMTICNRDGILSGHTGGNQGGVPMEKTSYRQSRQAGSRPTADLPVDYSTLLSQAQITVAPPSYGESDMAMISRPPGYNPAPQLRDMSYYKKMTGPPLAPDFERSRVITNYEVEISSSLGTASLTGKWTGIQAINRKTKEVFEFLEKLFEGVKLPSGKVQIPQRDLRGATDYENAQVLRQVKAWVEGTAEGWA